MRRVILQSHDDHSSDYGDTAGKVLQALLFFSISYHILFYQIASSGILLLVENVDGLCD